MMQKSFKMKNLFLTISFTILSIYAISAQLSEDVKAVESACFDYIHTFYKADVTLAERSIHPSIRKTGFYYMEDKSQYSEQLELPYEEFLALAKRWNADGSRANENTPKEVEIFEVADQTAVAKITAVWGIDYVSLAKYGDKWQIVNVLWQSPPKDVFRPE